MALALVYNWVANCSRVALRSIMKDSEFWCHLARVIGRASYIIETTALGLDHEYYASRTGGLCFPGCNSWVRLKLWLAPRLRHLVHPCLGYSGPVLTTHICGLTGIFAKDGQLHGLLSGMVLYRE